MGGALLLQVASNFGNGTQVGLIDRGCDFMSGRCPVGRGSPFVGGCLWIAWTVSYREFWIPKVEALHMVCLMILHASSAPGWALLVVASLGFVTNLHVYNVLQISTMPLGVLNFIGCELKNLTPLPAWDWRL